MSDGFKIVLTVIAAPHWGGLQVVVERTTPHYKAAGFRRIVALPDTDGETRQRLELAGCTVISLPLGRPRRTLNPAEHLQYLRRFGRDVKAIEKIIATECVDIVEVAGLLNLQPVIAARNTKTPLVWQMHSTLAPASVRYTIGRYAARTAEVIMTSGTEMAQRHGGIRSGRAEIVPFCAPIDLEQFSADFAIRREVRAQLGYKPNDIVVGTLGNRTWQKRHDWIVQMALRLNDPKLQFAIVGSAIDSNDSYYRSCVLKPIQTAGLGNVRVIDQNRPAHEMMNAFDVFVLPSLAEGASLVTAEAMATALPIVASDVGSLPDLVRPGENGFLCDVNSLEEYCNAIGQLRDSELRHTMGGVSRRLAEDNLGQKRCAEAHFYAYQRALAAR